jgi:hypothetical protein
MHEFLVRDCKAFLPKIEATTIFFMKQITKAEKDVSAKLEICSSSSFLQESSLSIPSALL